MHLTIYPHKTIPDLELHIYRPLTHQEEVNRAIHNLYQSGKTLKEISEMTGYTLGTVKFRLKIK